ncbi:MAG: TMAO reductase system periplasmic protein TorT [Gammaproteobacteria bacterium]|nr:TMAO reductase system periplasmic protein TorT [Gammaproteobacteria bacterium]
MNRIAMLLLLGLLTPPRALPAEPPWYPLDVELGPVDAAQRPVRGYQPLARAAKPWRLCANLPHMKDSYWLGVHYGLKEEARRLGVALRIDSAGGYDSLAKQIAQLRACARDSEGIIIGAISYTGLNALVGELRQSGKVVIDLVNGMESPQVSARSLVSFRAMGKAAGRYLRQQSWSTKARPRSVLWFPGPEGAGWVLAGDAGFRQGIAHAPLRILGAYHGDTRIDAQRELLLLALKEHPRVDFIVGTSVTADAAVQLRSQGLLPKATTILAYYFTQNTYSGIRTGQILAAPTDAPVSQARIAVDLAVRALEGQPYEKVVSPRITLLDHETLKTYDRQQSLAPRGYTGGENAANRQP